MEEDYKKLNEEYKSQIEDLQKELKRLEKENNDYKSTRKMVAHELKSPLNAVMGFASLLKEREYQEKSKEFATNIERSAKRILNLSELLYLDGISKEELINNSRTLNIEEIARTHGKEHEHFFEQQKIKLEIKYNKNNGFEPIQAYMHDATINAVWGTLLGNCINYSPEETKIQQGISINNKENLEILLENRHTGSRKRKIAGMEKQIGMPFVQKIISLYNGKFSNYHHAEIENKEYAFRETIGFKELEPQEEGDIWGVKIEIPMKYLTKKD